MKKQKKFPVTTGVREQRKVDIAVMRRLAGERGDWKLEADLARIEADKHEALVDKQRRGLRGSAQSANEKRKAERQAEHARWRATASEVRADSPNLTTKTAVATAVKKRLSLTDSVRTVRRIID